MESNVLKLLRGLNGLLTEFLAELPEQTPSVAASPDPIPTETLYKTASEESAPEPEAPQQPEPVRLVPPGTYLEDPPAPVVSEDSGESEPQKGLTETAPAQRLGDAFPLTPKQVMTCKRRQLRELVAAYNIPVTGPNGESPDEMFVGPLRNALCTYLRAQEMQRAMRASNKNTEEAPQDPEPAPAAPAPTPETALVVAKTPERYSHINFSPPKAVVTELKRGLKWNEEGHGGDGLRPETVSWARRMANGSDISPEKAVKMRAWLARHESDKSGEGFNPGEDGYPSPGRVAWALWGGDPAKGWSEKLVGQMEAADAKKVEAPEAELIEVDAPEQTIGPKGETFLAWVREQRLKGAETTKRMAEDLEYFFGAHLPSSRGPDRKIIDAYFEKMGCANKGVIPCTSCPHGGEQPVFCYGIFEEEVPHLDVKTAQKGQYFQVDPAGTFVNFPSI